MVRRGEERVERGERRGGDMGRGEEEGGDVV